MKKVIMLAVILGWMGLGCGQSQCNGNRCMIIKQARGHKVQSPSFQQTEGQATAVNDSSTPTDLSHLIP